MLIWLKKISRVRCARCTIVLSAIVSLNLGSAFIALELRLVFDIVLTKWYCVGQ